MCFVSFCLCCLLVCILIRFRPFGIEKTFLKHGKCFQMGDLGVNTVLYDDCNWICAICLIPPHFGYLLEEQYILNLHSDPRLQVYMDHDRETHEQTDPWVRCDKCMHTFHLRCVSSLPLKIVRHFGFQCC